MTNRLQNMTQGKPRKLIFTFALPLMLGNVFQQLYTVVDTMVESTWEWALWPLWAPPIG